MSGHVLIDIGVLKHHEYVQDDIGCEVREHGILQTMFEVKVSGRNAANPLSTRARVMANSVTGKSDAVAEICPIPNSTSARMFTIQILLQKQKPSTKQKRFSS